MHCRENKETPGINIATVSSVYNLCALPATKLKAVEYG